MLDIFKAGTSAALVLVSVLGSGCATSSKGIVGAHQAEAGWIILQGVDEALGCPLDFSRRAGEKLVDPKNCPDPKDAPAEKAVQRKPAGKETGNETRKTK